MINCYEKALKEKEKSPKKQTFGSSAACCNLYIGCRGFDTIIHFFESFASSAKINVYGEVKGFNDHHKAEAIFKAFARALKDAIKVEHNQIPSTKGILS